MRWGHTIVTRTHRQDGRVVPAIVGWIVALLLLALAPVAEAQGRGVILPRPLSIPPFWRSLFYASSARQVRARRGASRFAGWRTPRGSRSFQARRTQAPSSANAGIFGAASAPLV